MKQRFKRIIGVSAVLLLVSCTGGCWDAHELDTLSIVTGVGIDAAQPPGEINFIVQIGKVTQSTSKGEKSSDDNHFQLLEVSSKSVLDAVDSLNRKSSRLLFLPHNEVIIFGKNQAENGVKPYLDYFMRDDEARMDMQIFVADGNAKDILSTKPEQEKITAVALSRMMENETHKSDVLNVSLLDFTSRLIEKTTSPVAPVVKNTEDSGNKKLVLSGMAVFKKDRLAGQLDKNQIYGYVWAMGGVKGGVLNVSTDAGNAALDIISATCKPGILLRGNGGITVSLKIDGQLAVGELQGFKDMKIAEVFPLLEQAAASEIQKQVAECFKTTQKLNTDIYGYGSAIHRTHPKAWKTMEAAWDQLYPTLTLSLNIKVSLTGSGKISDSLSMEEDHP